MGGADQGLRRHRELKQAGGPFVEFSMFDRPPRSGVDFAGSIAAEILQERRQ
jgi:hypothetical protein